MRRIPVTLADLQGSRYKSSLSKFKKHALPKLGNPKLSALREAFAKALGYGTEAELRFYAKTLGDSYTGATLPIADVIVSVSTRIARQWDVTAQFADSVTSSLGLQHFDACRITQRANPRNTNGDMTSKPATQVSMDDPFNPHTFEDGRTVIHAVSQNLSASSNADLGRLDSSNWGQAKAAIDELMKANPAQAAIDKLMKANPAQAAINELMKANPAQAAIDELMKANPAQAAIDKLMKANPAQAAIDKLMKANPAQAAVDKLMKANPAQAAIDELMKANPAQAAIDKLMKANPAQAAIDKLMKANPAQAAVDKLMKA
ncbi:hypothetical protein, partial [Pseudomonas syringae]|uniref:hypothetical protein n=3 Tax=Pseudomonas syringae group TaxID=136849 RepID=UPI0032D91003